MGRGRPAPGHRPRRLVVVALVAVGVVLGAAAPASAHAQLVSSDPVDGSVVAEAPEQVTLSFDESVRLTGQEIAVYDDAGATVPSEATASGTEVVVELPDAARMDRGTFVVGWYVLSADGHPVAGALTFSVGERSAEVAAPPPPPESSAVVTVAQGLLGGALYVGLLVAVGLTGFVAWVLPATYGGERLRSRIRGLVRVSAVVAVVAAWLLVPVSAVYGQGAELASVMSSFDTSLVVDELLAAALVTVSLGSLAALLPVMAPDPRRRLVLTAVGVVALFSPALAGHTRAYEPQALLVVADLVHLSAGALWLGGLVGLVLALRALAGRERLAAVTLARFSTLAGGLLVAVAAAGTVLAWRVLGSWSALVDTGYGQLLLVKIAIALLVAAVGAWNRFGMLPRVQAASGFADRSRAASLVSRTVALEASLLVVLLGVTGFLVNRSPQPEPVEVPQGQSGVQGSGVADLEVLAVMSPRVQGPNTLLVQLQDQEGEPVVLRRPPEVELRTAGLDLGSVPVVDTDAGTWRADVLVPRAGLWEVQVSVPLSRFERPVTTLRFSVVEPES